MHTEHEAYYYRQYTCSSKRGHKKGYKFTFSHALAPKFSCKFLLNSFDSILLLWFITNFQDSLQTSETFPKQTQQKPQEACDQSEGDIHANPVNPKSILAQD